MRVLSRSLRCVLCLSSVLVFSFVSVSSGEEFPVPTTGEVKAEFAPLDQVVVDFMKLVDASAGSLAVSRNGELLYSRGFGWQDSRRRRATEPDALFRIASVSKPITSALIKTAIRDGKLTADQKVFELLSKKLGPTTYSDPRLEQITVQHLLDHKGGWDWESSFDPMFREREIQQTLRVRGSLEPWHVVRYMTQQPLQFDPGTKSKYSNFGYCLLGRVLEVTYDRPYYESLDAMILQPLEIKDIKLAASSSRKRDRREVWYPVDDRAFAIEMMDSMGGLVASAPALCRFLDAYWLSGEPRVENQQYSYWFFGSLPGTTAYVKQAPGGWNVAVLINNRHDETYDEENDSFAKEISRVLETFDSEPTD